jgi:AbrB family looped-hinge helix DNA binding protein
MTTATLTSKGQTTIPREVRERLGLAPGDVLKFTVLPDGAVIMRHAKPGAESLAGMLHAPQRPPVGIEAMEAAIAAAAAARALPSRNATRPRRRR